MIENGDPSIAVQLHFENPIRRIKRFFCAVCHHRGDEGWGNVLGHLFEKKNRIAPLKLPARMVFDLIGRNDGSESNGSTRGFINPKFDDREKAIGLVVEEKGQSSTEKIPQEEKMSSS